MKKTFTIFFLLLLSVSTFAQMAEKPRHHVYVYDQGQLYDIKPEQTQTEVKPGWQIVDYETAPRTVRYVWGRTSVQLASADQSFVIDPHEYVLTDFVVVPLKQKSEYRRLQKAKMDQNKYIVFDPAHFNIKSTPDDNYLCTPLLPFKKGEYAVVCLRSPQVSDAGDYELFTFSVK